MAKGKAGRPSTKGTSPARIGCTIPRSLFDRLEAFRENNYKIQRALVMQLAIERFLDREASLKRRKAKS